MEILEGALAFSVVMIIHATVVTGITEAWLRWRRKRQALLASALRQMILDLSKKKGAPPDDTSPPLFHPAEGDGGKPDAGWPDRLVDDLTFNDALGPIELYREPSDWSERVSAWTADLFGAVSYAALHPGAVRNPGKSVFPSKRQYLAETGKTLSDFAEGELKQGMKGRADADRLPHKYRVDQLTPEGFARRLGRNETCKEVFRHGRNCEAVLRAYLKYRALSQEKFRKYAAAAAIWFAMATALVFNIDAGRIFLYVMEDDTARKALIESAPEISAAYKDYLDQLSKTDDPLLKNELEEKIAAIRDLYGATLGKLDEEHSLPIGFDYFPHCAMVGALKEPPLKVPEKLWDEVWELFDKPEKAKEDAGCQKSEGEVQVLGVWFLNVLIAGFLIGLGGPFWYKVFDGLSRLSRMLGRGGGPAVDPELLGDNGDIVKGAAPKTDRDIVLEAVRAAQDERRLLGWDVDEAWLAAHPETVPAKAGAETPGNVPAA